MFTWNSTWRIIWSISTLRRIQKKKTNTIWKLSFVERGNLWRCSSYLKNRKLLLLFHKWVNFSRNSTHFAAGSWSVWIKPKWDFNRAQVCEFNGLWADREAFGPNTDVLKSKVPHYYTSWKFWKIRVWSGHDNSNSCFNINFMFKY